MELFNTRCESFFNQFGNAKKMVLSTSLNDKVTSRMMSIIRIGDAFYFQTDKSFRKYEQISKNSNVALCIENIQIEGVCSETGHPLENSEFCNMYKQYFKSSYDRYTGVRDERLFIIRPVYIQKWIYEEKEPFVEVYEFERSVYEKKQYIGI